MRRTAKPVCKREPFEILREADKDVKTARVSILAQPRSLKFRLHSHKNSCQSPLRRLDFLKETFLMALGMGAYVRWVRFRMIL